MRSGRDLRHDAWYGHTVPDGLRTRGALVRALIPLALTTIAATAEMPVDAATIERGRALYGELYCGACHRLDAVGAQGFFGPPHDDMATVARARAEDPSNAGRWVDARAYLREAIRVPTAHIVPGYGGGRHAMPAYDVSDEDLTALVEFLMTQHGVGD
jgi:mono/diheme cytochrome c family protein